VLVDTSSQMDPGGSLLQGLPYLQCTMIVHQPDIPAPVLINFPLPARATRGEEVDDQDLDRVARDFAGRF